MKLLLGDRVASAHPNAIGVSSVVNCAPMHVPRHPSVQYYLEVDLADAPALNAEGGVAFEDAATHFERAAAFIKAELDAGRSVLVHCAGGVSRSATITLAYLILVNPYLLSMSDSFVINAISSGREDDSP